MKLTPAQKNIVQVSAFKAFYKSLREDIPNVEERFITAICMSSDEKLEAILKGDRSNGLILQFFNGDKRKK